MVIEQQLKSILKKIPEVHRTAIEKYIKNNPEINRPWCLNLAGEG